MKTAPIEPSVANLQAAIAAALARGSRTDNPSMAQVVKDSWPGIKAMMLQKFRAKEICAVFNETGYEMEYTTFVQYLSRNGYTVKRANKEQEEDQLDQPPATSAKPTIPAAPAVIKPAENSKPAASKKVEDDAKKVAPDGADLREGKTEQQRQVTDDDVSPEIAVGEQAETIAPVPSGRRSVILKERTGMLSELKPSAPDGMVELHQL